MISSKYRLRRVRYNPNNTKLTGEVDRIHGTCPLTPEDSGRDGNYPDGNRERTTGNIDDQLCVCRMSRVETETELDL